jgi:fluoroacetyl-CoA thioesterase
MDLKVGLTHRLTRTVTERHLATQWGSGLARVLATPALIAFCETCCRLAVDSLLPEGQQSVGTSINLRHLAATPPGLDVTVRAELTEVDGRRLLFRIEAWDSFEQIGEGEHERFVIDVERFQRRVAEKAKRADESGDSTQGG